jgi:class 3 adenylate cyclase
LKAQAVDSGLVFWTGICADASAAGGSHAETRKLAVIMARTLSATATSPALIRAGRSHLRALRSDLIDPAIATHTVASSRARANRSIIEFRSVVDAVRCAIGVQTGLIERNAGVPPERRIEFRVGIHVGDVCRGESDGDLVGDDVNIAARLEGVAKPAGICFSEDAMSKKQLDRKVRNIAWVSDDREPYERGTNCGTYQSSVD